MKVAGVVWGKFNVEPWIRGMEVAGWDWCLVSDDPAWSGQARMVEASPYTGLARAGWLKAQACARGYVGMDCDILMQRPCPVPTTLSVGMCADIGNRRYECLDGREELNSGLIVVRDASVGARFLDTFVWAMTFVPAEPWRDEIAASWAFYQLDGLLLDQRYNTSHRAAELGSAFGVHYHGHTKPL
jgi:hypothetical protein